MVDDFDDSDYSLPVHLRKATFVHALTKGVIESWKEKRRLQKKRQRHDATFTRRKHFMKEEEFEKKFRRSFTGKAIMLVKYMLANGEQFATS